MNNYDEIKTILFSTFDVKIVYEYLCNYIKNYCTNSFNKDKNEKFYRNLSEILRRILYIPEDTKLINLKQNRSLLENLNLKSSKFEEFDILLNLFLVSSSKKDTNLFSAIFLNSTNSTKFLFPLKSSSVKNLFSTVDVNSDMNLILNRFSLFEMMSNKKEDIERYLYDGELILTTQEYFIVLICNFIKNSSLIHKLDIKDCYQNYKKFLENFSEKDLFCEKSKFILSKFNRNRSISYNFYNIFFVDFLNFLDFNNHQSSRFLFDFLISAIEFLWLGNFHFFSISEFVAKNTNQTNHIFENSLYSNSKERNKYLFKSSFEFNNSPTEPLPNLLVLECLKNLISLLQNKKYLFSEKEIKGEKKIALKDNVHLFRLQNALFNFFKNGFIFFAKENVNSEISLSDFASVWYTYITPWESNCESNIESSKFTSNETFNVNRFSNLKSPLTKKVFYNDTKNQKKYSNIYLEYVEFNLLFYTDLFQDYLKAFYRSNIISEDELSILLSLMEIYQVSDNGLFIHKSVNLEKMKDYSYGYINVKKF